MMNEKQMRIKESLERSKTLRTKASAGRKGANIVAERDYLDDIHGSKKMYWAAPYYDSINALQLQTIRLVAHSRSHLPLFKH